MKRLLFLSFLLFTGCNGCEGLKKKVGLGNDEQIVESKEDKEKRLEEEKQKLEEEKKRLEEEKQRLAEEKKRFKEQQLRDADALVQEMAEHLQKNATSKGFTRIEGATELDPWGNALRIDYSQDWFDEIATIRSAGPDGKMDTFDDIIRTKKTSNVNGILHGMGWIAWLVLIWLATGIFAILFSVGIANHRRGKGLSHKHKHPLVFLLAVAIFAPVLFLIFGLQLTGSVLGFVGDFFDGFDFDFGD